MRLTYIIFFSCLYFFPAYLLAQPAPTWRADSLTIEAIMRDPAWIGHSPKRPYWSEDSKHLYFTWNPAPTEGDSLYRVSQRGGTPRPVSPEQREQLRKSYRVHSPKGSAIAYVFQDDLYYQASADIAPRQLTAAFDDIRNLTFDLTGERLFFQSGNDFFALELEEGFARQISDFRSGKAPSPTSSLPDQQSWLSRQERQLIDYVDQKKRKDSLRAVHRQKGRDTEPRPYYYGYDRPENMMISPDGRFITFRLRNQPNESESTNVPDYIRSSGYATTRQARPKVGSPQATFEFGIYDREADTVLMLELGQVPGIGELPMYLQEQITQNRGEPELPDVEHARDVMVMGPSWSDDARHAVVEIRSLDFKDRWLMRLDAGSGSLTLLDRQRDEAWIDGPGIRRWIGQPGSQGWLPDNRTYWFISEESGYAHLYTIDVETGKRTPMTAGKFEVFDVQVSRDGMNWYYTSSEVHPGERHFYRLPIGGGVPERLTSMSGNNQVTLSPDEKTLAIRHSTSNRPWELFLQPNRPNAKAKRITKSLSSEFLSYPWRDPELVNIPASDETLVPARIYQPREGTSPNGKAVIFVHGAGYLQNAHKWWSSYFREYMFHNLLADQGYIVLDLDYRGSAGYGRDWRTAIYRHMGSKDLSDQVDAAKYLAETFDIDSTSIGIYGGSYGGFITLMAMFTEPGVFAAGAALRPVTDWAHYNHPYTASILNQPQDDSLSYLRSSPIYFAEGLEGGLLICHGMVDTNVHFQDVVRLNQRLIELGKRDWTVAMYPVEGHGFTEPSSWTDEYRRIYELFEEYLR